MRIEDQSPHPEWLFKSLVRNGRQIRDEEPGGEEEEEEEGEDEATEEAEPSRLSAAREDAINPTSGILIGGLLAAFTAAAILLIFLFSCKRKQRNRESDKPTYQKNTEASYYVNFWSADSTSPLSEAEEKPRYLPQPLVFDHPGQICKNAEKFIDRCMRNTVKRTYSEPTKEMINKKRWSSRKVSVEKDDDSVEDLKHKIKNFLKDIKESINREKETQKQRSVHRYSLEDSHEVELTTEKILETEVSSECFEINKYEQMPPCILSPDISEIWTTTMVTSEQKPAAEKKVSQIVLPKPTNIEGQIEKIEELINMCVENLREPFMEKFPDRAPSFGKLMKGNETDIVADPRPPEEDDVAKLKEYTEIFKRVFSSQIKRSEKKPKGVDDIHKEHWKLKTIDDNPQEDTENLMNWFMQNVGKACAKKMKTYAKRRTTKGRTAARNDDAWRLRMLYRDMEKNLNRWKATTKKLGKELAKAGVVDCANSSTSESCDCCVINEKERRKRKK